MMTSARLSLFDRLESVASGGGGLDGGMFCDMASVARDAFLLGVFTGVAVDSLDLFKNVSICFLFSCWANFSEVVTFGLRSWVDFDLFSFFLDGVASPVFT